MRRAGDAAGSSGRANEPRRATVLVVDDNAVNRKIARSILEGSHEIVEAHDAATAMAALAQYPVDVVLLDVMMPGTSGLEVCRQIKSSQGNTFLPVLLLTALNEQRDRNAGLEAGADDFLTKPIDRQELALRVRAFLRIREQDLTIRRQVESLRALDALKDDLVSLVVHDLRNPLTGLLGMLHVMQDEVTRGGGGSGELGSDIALALTAARRLQDTLDDMLQVRQLEEGRLALARAPHSLDELVTDTIDAAMSAARVRGVGVHRASTGGDVTLHVDRALVRRALENLMTNAIAHTPRGADVEVRTAVDGDVAAIEVADRGAGIPASVRPYLFEKFGAVGTRDPGARRGFGLGLYLVRLVATAHGGEVLTEDREGGGTSFRLLLPVAPPR